MKLTAPALSAAALALLPLLAPAGIAPARAAPENDPLVAAAAGLEPILELRYRYEHVDQAEVGPVTDEAHASTLRTRFGFRTGAWHGLRLLVEGENITAFGGEAYNSTVNGRTRFPVVADPDGTEMNRAWLAYEGPQGLLKAGRQRIIYDNARFIGNVGWRQNEQTFDAFRGDFTGLPHTRLSYAYLSRAHRIFGDDSPAGDADLDGHLLNLAYTPAAPWSAVAYGYFLDFDDTPPSLPPAASTRTLGLRLNGALPLSGPLKLVATGEYASQRDYRDGAAGNDADYALGELSLVHNATAFLVGYEWLQGDGSYGFSTPLATLHAFQGWTDRFLVTPGDGIRDRYLSISTRVAGVKLAAVYHDFESDEDSYDYGDEWGLLAVRPFAQRYAVGVKYADYDADRNATNLARNGAPAVSTEMLWVWLEAKL